MRLRSVIRYGRKEGPWIEKYTDQRVAFFDAHPRQ